MARNIDWIAIKNDYVYGDDSYRSLASKYEVSKNQISNRAQEEHWQELRKKERDKIGAKLGQKTAEKIIEDKTSRLERLLNLCDKTIYKLEKALEQVEDENGEVDTNNLRKIVQSLKDVKEVIGDDVSSDDMQTQSHNELIAAIRGHNEDK